MDFVVGRPTSEAEILFGAALPFFFCDRTARSAAQRPWSWNRIGLSRAVAIMLGTTVPVGVTGIVSSGSVAGVVGVLVGVAVATVVVSVRPPELVA